MSCSYTVGRRNKSTHLKQKYMCSCLQKKSKTLNNWHLFTYNEQHLVALDEFGYLGVIMVHCLVIKLRFTRKVMKTMLSLLKKEY